MTAMSLMMSRVIVDELRKLETQQRETNAAENADSSALRLPRRRLSLAVERHVHLIQMYLMLELGYELPDFVVGVAKSKSPQGSSTGTG